MAFNYYDMKGSKNHFEIKPSEANSYFKPRLIESMAEDVKQEILMGSPEMLKNGQGKFLFDGILTDHGVVPVAVFAVWQVSVDKKTFDSFQIVKYLLNPGKLEAANNVGQVGLDAKWRTTLMTRNGSHRQLEEIKSKCWSLLEILRKEPIASNEYVVILYLISLLRDKVNLVVNRQRDQSTKVELPFVAASWPGTTPIARALEPLQIIHDVFRPTLEKLSDRAFQAIKEFSNSFEAKAFDENFPQIFDDLLYKINSYQGRTGGEYMQPIELSRFVCGLAGLPPNARVYNPFAGVGSFELFLDDSHNYLGQEINHTTWAIGSLRMMAYGRIGNSVFLRGDSINNWNPRDEKYDLIVATPPFGMRLPKEVPGKFGSVKTCEHFLIEKGIEDLTPKGKLVAVIPHGFLFRGGAEKSLRQFLIENDLLEMVISLPGGLLANTEIPIAVLVVNKNKELKGRVLLIEAKEFVDSTSRKDRRLNDHALNAVIHNVKETSHSKLVSNTEIGGSDFDYNVARYFAPKVEGVQLGDLVNVIRGWRRQAVGDGKLVHVKDLKDDKLDFKLVLKDIETGEESRQGQLIAESCLLITTRWRTLKPTFFEYAGESISITTDISALRVDEAKVDVRFLVKELNADYVNGQLESFRTGSIIPTIKLNDLLAVKIKLPPIEEQRTQVKEVVEALAEEKRKELQLLYRINGLESEIVEQNTYLRHTLAGPTSNLKDSLANIRKIINEKVSSIIPDIKSLKVSDAYELTLGQYLDVLERDINKISDAVRRQLKVEMDIESKLLTSINIIGWMAGFVKEYSDKKNLNFELKFDFDTETFLDSNGQIRKTFILANVDLLSGLFHNLIDNAATHAFADSPGPHRIELYLSKFSEIETQNEIYILVSNTGRTFPENFNKGDFVRKGSKTGVNAGEGFGGWYINEIVKRLNGSFDIIDETGREGLTDSDLTTSFEINFPIIESEENEEV